MKIAHIILDTAFNTLTFHYKDVNITYGISPVIKTLKLRQYDRHSNIEFDTNVGVEAIDIINPTLLPLSKHQLNTVKEFFEAKDSQIKVFIYG